MIKQRDGIDIWLHRSAFSLCILFRRTNPAITFKYSLCEAQEAVSIDGVKYNRHYVHLYCMWDRKQTTLDSLMIDLAQPGAFDKTAEIILSNSALG